MSELPETADFLNEDAILILILTPDPGGFHA